MALKGDEVLFLDEDQSPAENQKLGPRASGVRILFNFNGCKGPMTEKEGLHDAVRRAVEKSKITVLGKVRFKRFPDDTANSSWIAATADLSESHFGMGTYLEARHVAGEVNMCHEKCNNTELAVNFVACLREEFKPESVDINVLPWSSR